MSYAHKIKYYVGGKGEEKDTKDFQNLLKQKIDPSDIQKFRKDFNHEKKYTQAYNTIKERFVSSYLEVDQLTLQDLFSGPYIPNTDEHQKAKTIEFESWEISKFGKSNAKRRNVVNHLFRSSKNQRKSISTIGHLAKVAGFREGNTGQILHMLKEWLKIRQDENLSSKIEAVKTMFRTYPSFIRLPDAVVSVSQGKLFGVDVKDHPDFSCWFNGGQRKVEDYIKSCPLDTIPDIFEKEERSLDYDEAWKQAQ